MLQSEVFDYDDKHCVSFKSNDMKFIQYANTFTFKGAIMISMVTLTTGGLTNQHPAFIVRRPVWPDNTLTTQRRKPT